ncbi:hypothetical protein P879_09312 [Paragonimus westermani]|uniref:Uncharacterized protein n=1 Tax=Paragonimus westermani TaxID=34504 RepID=A0A8T0DAX2_9TREM|nr:hypothetical protein P879_09312 [Paragonimus westermani]
MLDLTAILFLVSISIVYAVYAITWLCWYIWKDKSGIVIVDTEYVLFSGGPKYIRNVMFLGIAISQLFSPCLLNEHFLSSGLSTIMMLVSRIAALGISVIFFNHLATLRFRNVEEYLLKRFDSRVLFILHLFNRMVGIYYLWHIYLYSYETFHLFNLTSSLEFMFVMIAFGSLSALGGMNVILVGCAILWFLETVGQSFLFSKAYPNMFSNTSIFTFRPDPCYSQYGLNYFLIILCQILSVQPAYALFQAANNTRQANIAMLVGILLLTTKTVLYACSANGLLDYANKHELHFRDSIHGQYNLSFEQPQLFRLRQHKPQKAEHVHTVANISFPHFFTIFSVFGCNTIAYYLLQTQTLAMHTYLHILPNWLRSGLISDGRELHLTFSCLYLFCAYLTVVFFVYPHHIIPPKLLHAVDYHLFKPFLSSMMSMPVISFVLLGPLCSDFWSIPAIIVSLSTFISGAIFVSQNNPEVDSCVDRWLPTFLFVPAFLASLLLSWILRAPRFLPNSLLFRHHMSLRRRPEKTRSLSILADGPIIRPTRSNFRIGGPS